MAWWTDDHTTQEPSAARRMLVPAILLGLIASFVMIGSRPVAAAPPGNDDFAAATTMVGNDGELLAQTNVDATAEVDEPSHDGLPFTPTHSVWYDWTPTATAMAKVHVYVSGSWDPVLAIYTGSAVDSLTEIAATHTTGSNIGQWFSADAGTTYRIAIDGVDSTESGTFRVEWTIPSPNDMFDEARELLGDGGIFELQSNEQSTAEPGEPAHHGRMPIRSVWYEWTPSIGGRAAVDVTADGWSLVVAAYTGSAVDALTPIASDGGATSEHIEFDVTAGTTYSLVVDSWTAGNTGGFDISYSITSLPNDDFADATALAGDSGALVAQSNDAATAETGEPDHHGRTPVRSVWYEWTPSIGGKGAVTATSDPYTTWTTVLAVYTGTAVDSLTPVVSAGGGSTSLVEFRIDGGTTYRIAVDGWTASSTGSFDIDWAIVSPPNDDFVAATPMVGDAGWLLDQTNADATAEAGEPNHAGRTPKVSVWYDWTPSTAGDAVVNATMQSTFDEIVVAVYTGASVDTLTEVTASPGNMSHTRRLEFPVTGGTTYHLVVDGYDAGDTGTFDLTWALSPPPNDDFGERIALDERNGVLVGTTEGATPEIMEPTHGGVPGTPAHSVWYEWTPIWDGDAEIDLDTPSAPDDWTSVVAVYTDDQLGLLAPVASASTAGTHVDLDFPVIGGTTYQVVVDGQANGEFGTFDLTWSYTPYGGTFLVTKTDDTADGVCDSDCSLREAIAAANATGGDDTITLPAGQYDLTLYLEDELHVERETGTTSVIGAGAETTVIDATRLGDLGPSWRWRVISVGYHAGLELVGVTITGGYTVTGADKDGAGVLNMNGTLTITNSIIEDNWSGEDGGGISNQLGTATITNSIIRNNSTNPPEYSTWSVGGGIYNSGTMTIVGSTIVSNESSNDGGGVGSDGGVLSNDAELHVVNTLIAGNTAQRGGGIFSGDGTSTITDATVVDNQTFGYFSGGGGIFNWDVMTITDSVIDGNSTTSTSFYIETGSGGGVQNRYPGDLTITGTTITNNTATNDQWDTSPLLGGRGGGVINAGGIATIENSTIAGNTAAMVDRWDPYGYPYLDGGAGGGVAHMLYVVLPAGYCPVTVLDGVTITDNTAAHGGGVNSRWEDDLLGLYGRGNWPSLVVDDPYSLECPDFYVTNSIIAGNHATISAGTEDSWGGYTSVGYNLVGVGTGAPSGGPGDVATADPMLSPLADFGGPTETYALLPGSPAIDAGATDLTVDQRAIARPQGAADDIGAFEVDAGPNAAPVLGPIGILTVTEGDVLDVPISATDADGDVLVFWINGAPAFASLTDHGDGTATLSLAPGYADHGSYPGVVVTVSDAVAIDDETITIDVIDANGTPTADDQSVFAWQDTSVDIVLAGSDPDPDPITFDIETPPSHGRLTGTPPNVTYTPDERYLGDDSFTFVVDDGQVPSPAATVSITVHDIRPDPRFGTDGMWVSGFGGNGQAEAVIELPDGSVVAAGWTVQGGTDSAILKLTPDGALDPTFGTGGVVAGTITNFADLVHQTDGKLVVVGAAGGDPAIARFDVNGALDATFGTGGIVTVDLNGAAKAVALHADGKIVVGWEDNDDDVGVLRLLPDGTPDATFGTAGIFSVPRGGNTWVSDVVVQPDGKIVLLWTWHHGTTFDDQVIEIARLLPDGSPDATFDTDGRTDIDLDQFAAGHGLALQTDGKLVIAGETWEPFDRNAIVARLTAAGALDATFGAGGTTHVAYGTDFEQFNDVALLADGTILVAGSAGVAGERDGIVARLLPDGGLDTTFDLDGKVIGDLGNDEDNRALAVQADGRMLFAGQWGSEWGVLRLISTVTYPVACDGRDASVITAYGETPTAGPDVIAGTPGPDVIDGLDGDDIVCGFEGDDVLAGGLGLDRIMGGAGVDDVDGGKGNDLIWGGPDSDVLYGGGGGDRIWGEGGGDELRGGNGNDRLYGGPGRDELRGQNGSDLVYANDDVDFSTTAVDTVYGGGLYDDVYGDAGDDTIYGGNFADVLSGKSGDDSLYGNNGADTLRGGPHILGDYCNGGIYNSGSGDTATACEIVENVP
ncbi:MAG: choice-of-anchor Q domain-containing protein [Ilumatobacter sp.]|uniref:choice-of-anchor Q domain-containing protein n=1 Tax=Ilumatobacter sp. TaxID=1967498 RepID=UPI00260F591D|nr:choice-of-anchor Q domain-containing protein [Ilumatobacter sp.]MDJ0770626.1 choice-of-anchor Q domain-containing protein [Ilumatobacter sp.]